MAEPTRTMDTVESKATKPAGRFSVYMVIRSFVHRREHQAGSIFRPARYHRMTNGKLKQMVANGTIRVATTEEIRTSLKVVPNTYGPMMTESEVNAQDWFKSKTPPDVVVDEVIENLEDEGDDDADSSDDHGDVVNTDNTGDTGVSNDSGQETNDVKKPYEIVSLGKNMYLVRANGQERKVKGQAAAEAMALELIKE